jgi:hypothetical protein
VSLDEIYFAIFEGFTVLVRIQALGDNARWFKYDRDKL